MDIRTMKYFQAVAEEGSISNASRQLNIAQPALSRQMKMLEEDLGVQLFERGSRRIKLTIAGQLLRERTEQILNLVEGTKKEVAEFDSGVAGSISIGTVTTSGAVLLPELVNQFHNLYPNVTLQVWEGDGYRILELLDKGIIEIGIVRAPIDSDIYNSITMPDEPLVIAMQKNCPFDQEQDTIRLRELAHQPLIIPFRWRSLFVSWCAAAGFKPNIVCLCNGIIMDILWAKKGIGMALVPQSTKELVTDPAITYKKIVDPTLSTQTAVVWHKNRRLSAGSSHFLDLIKDLKY
ncbi:MAG: LysR family transcriptional regulator [Acholeplasmataceae bacterium]|nr:LysR family transcriptional regulator [Acholeplasmataceae bacterium]